MDMSRAGGISAQETVRSAPTHMTTQQDALNFIEEILGELRVRLTETGFYVREQGEKLDTIAPPNDSAKDILSNTTQRIKKLAVDLKDQISQVC